MEGHDQDVSEEQSSSKRARLLSAIEASVYMPHLKELLNNDVPGLSLHQSHSEYRRGDFSVLYSACMDRAGDHPSPDAGSKRKRVDCSPGQGHAIGRPWDRSELYMRLQTFKSMTWFAKPEKIGAVECARRGWENTAADELTCETCRAVLVFPKNVDLDVMPAVVTSFEKKLETTHDQMCPWRSSVCSMSLLEFPTTLPDMTMLADFESRVAALKKLLCIPPISKEAVDMVAGGDRQEAVGRLLLANTSLKLGSSGLLRGGRASTKAAQQGHQGKERHAKNEWERLIAQLSSAVAFEREDTVARATFLALCGWSLRLLSGSSSGTNTLADYSSVKPDEAALQCTMCGTRLGMWSFFGDGRMPTVMGTRDTVVGPSPTFSSGASIAVNNQVAVNLHTTIAGGPFRSVPIGATTGPFGSPEAASGAFSMGYLAQDDTRRNSNGTTSSGAAASSVREQQGSRESRRLASYKASCRSPIDPLDAHKAYCPWANMNLGVAKPGWQVYLNCLDSHR